MPRKASVMVKEIEEPVIRVLTSEDIKNTFTDEDYNRIAKQCRVRAINDYKQSYSIWLQDASGDFHVIMKDKSNKCCTYLGAYEGAKFDVVLDGSFFNSLKQYFAEKANEDNNSINKFGSASNTSNHALQKT